MQSSSTRLLSSFVRAITLTVLLAAPIATAHAQEGVRFGFEGPALGTEKGETRDGSYTFLGETFTSDESETTPTVSGLRWLPALVLGYRPQGAGYDVGLSTHLGFESSNPNDARSYVSKVEKRDLRLTLTGFVNKYATWEQPWKPFIGLGLGYSLDRKEEDLYVDRDAGGQRQLDSETKLTFLEVVPQAGVQVRLAEHVTLDLTLQARFSLRGRETLFLEGLDDEENVTELHGDAKASRTVVHAVLGLSYWADGVGTAAPAPMVAARPTEHTQRPNPVVNQAQVKTPATAAAKSAERQPIGAEPTPASEPAFF